jgi:hypothetical protein
MTTTADDPITHEPPLTDPIDVELPGAPVQPARAQPARPVRRSNSRRTRVTVRRFGLPSVFKFAIIFSFCAMVILWLALMLIYFMLSAAGVIATVSYQVGCVVNTPIGTKTCAGVGIDAVRLFTWLFGAGIVMAIAASLFLTFTALIYNLIADIVGGVEVVLAEKRI